MFEGNSQRRNLSALAGVLALTTVVFGLAAPARAQVSTTVSGTISNTDRTWDAYINNNCELPPGPSVYTLRTATVTTTGAYAFSDQFNLIDAGIAFYSGVFDPADPSTNCVASVDDNNVLALASGQYTVVISDRGSNAGGNFAYDVDGPASVTFAPFVPVAPVPTMTEWAMILFGTILAGGAALHIQRRRQFS